MAGERSALARLLSLAESGGDALLEIEELISGAVGKAHIVGVTGPPGAGKSTLINRLTPVVLDHVERAAVLAVDPSSPFSGGAILGDRVRMQGGQYADAVFIRSMASRGEAGGLARAASTCVRLFDACGWPLVIVETLGIGQVELNIMNLADTVVVVLNPGWGDSIQANKAGLTEAGDVFAINKADKPGVEQTRTDLLESFALLPGHRVPAIVETVAIADTGIEDLWHQVDRHWRWLLDESLLEQRRMTGRRRVIKQLLTEELGRSLQAAIESTEGDRLLNAAAVGDQSIDATIEQMMTLIAR